MWDNQALTSSQFCSFYKILQQVYVTVITFILPHRIPLLFCKQKTRRNLILIATTEHDGKWFTISVKHLNAMLSRDLICCLNIKIFPNSQIKNISLTCMPEYSDILCYSLGYGAFNSFQILLNWSSPKWPKKIKTTFGRRLINKDSVLVIYFLFLLFPHTYVCMHACIMLVFFCSISFLEKLNQC